MTARMCSDNSESQIQESTTPTQKPRIVQGLPEPAAIPTNAAKNTMPVSQENVLIT